MRTRIGGAWFAAALLAGTLAVGPVMADNAMGYRLLSAQEAEQLPRNGGALGLDVERAQRITDDGMTFDIMRVKQVRRGSAGAQAGFAPGDMIVAVDGRVFPSIAAFAAYVGAAVPGRQIMVDYIPRNAGPQQAQRIAVAVGASGKSATGAQTAAQAGASSGGMSTGTKVAIGLGALLGCYELGCFSHRTNGATVNGTQPAQ